MLPEREAGLKLDGILCQHVFSFGFLLIKVSVSRDWAAKRSRDVSVTWQYKGNMPQSLRVTEGHAENAFSFWLF